MNQGLRLQIGDCAVLRGIGDLQDIFAAIQRAKPKILIALAVEPMCRGRQAVMLGRQLLRERFRNGGRRAQAVDRMRGINGG